MIKRLLLISLAFFILWNLIAMFLVWDWLWVRQLGEWTVNKRAALLAVMFSTYAGWVWAAYHIGNLYEITDQDYK